MNACIAHIEQIKSWFYTLAEQQRFFFPEKTDGVNYHFVQIDKSHTIDLFSYKATLLPPVKQLFPDGEVLFSYYKDSEGHTLFKQSTAMEPQILAGVRSCDLKAIYLMDIVFADGSKDIHYCQRREKTAIIAFDCLSPCDNQCFCQATHSLDFTQGADIFITPLSHSQCLLEILTAKGKQLVQTLAADPCDNTAQLKQQERSQRPEPFGRQFVVPLEQLSQIIHSEQADTVYEHYAQRCFSCGTCNLVCPSCYCFDTRDDFALDGQSGEKTRHWDACMTAGFAEVAGGHNFRGEASARQRHRLRRKFSYLPQRFSSTSFCTGCGRCGKQCTTDIDVFDIANDIALSVNAQARQAKEGID